MENKTSNEAKLIAIKGSLINSINTFEKTLLNMKSTVLVPTRLNDIDCENMVKNRINRISSSNENLYSVYSDLNNVSKILYGDRSNTNNKKVK
jgi:hypothetical protein